MEWGRAGRTWAAAMAVTGPVQVSILDGEDHGPRCDEVLDIVATLGWPLSSLEAIAPEAGVWLAWPDLEFLEELAGGNAERDVMTAGRHRLVVAELP